MLLAATPHASLNRLEVSMTTKRHSNPKTSPIVDGESIASPSSLAGLPLHQRLKSRMSRRVVSLLGANVAYALISNGASAQVSTEAVRCERYIDTRDGYCRNGRSNDPLSGRCSYPEYRKCCTDYGDSCSRKFLGYYTYNYLCCGRNSECRPARTTC